MYALAVLGFILAPVLQRRKVVILSVYLYSVVLNQTAKVIRKPLAALLVAKVQQPVVVALGFEQPLRALHVDLSAGLHSFRLQPEHQIGAALSSPMI